jgi:hypothetical protein
MHFHIKISRCLAKDLSEINNYSAEGCLSRALVGVKKVDNHRDVFGLGRSIVSRVRRFTIIKSEKREKFSFYDNKFPHQKALDRCSARRNKKIHGPRAEEGGGFG